jgi:hypothetical protein
MKKAPPHPLMREMQCLAAEISARVPQAVKWLYRIVCRL